MSAKTVETTLMLEGLCCAQCAAKIEKAVQRLKGINAANLDFVSKKFFIELDPELGKRENKADIIKQITYIIQRIESGVHVVELTNKRPKQQTEKQSIRWVDFNNQLRSPLFWSALVGVVLFVVPYVAELTPTVEFTLFLVSYLLIGGEVVYHALRNMMRGQLFDENFLMVIATIGAFALRQYPEAVTVMLFYRIGEFFQDSAVERSRRSIATLMDIRPDYANLIDGLLERKTAPEDVLVGQMILIKPGEKVPLDGIVLDGRSVVDTSALTGEFAPREVEEGSDILAGFININGLLRVRVTKEFGQSTVARILELVENASVKKAPTENFITKFAHYYTPAVVLGAVLLACLPPLLLPGATFSEWLNRALIFLVVSCPCALVLSIPLSFFGGIGGASRHGILIKGSNYLEALNQVRTVVFDKTGTLTEGVFKVAEIVPANGYTKENILEWAAAAESYSGHPIAVSILKEFGQKINTDNVENYTEIPGQGVETFYKGQRILAGNVRLLENKGISFERASALGTLVYIAIENRYAGHILITDILKKDVPNTINGLRQAGIKNIIMLTGDNRAVSEEIGEQLAFDHVYAELLPDQKVAILEKLEEEKEKNSKLIFIGDGINDAPVLARADIGIAMGALGSDAAIEAADIVLMTDEPSKLLEGIQIARKTRHIVWQNILFALGIKIVVLALGALGMATLWEAVFADVGVALIAVLNAMRVLKIKSL
ncbi:cadmium-translocating P-type ATPase [Dehalobacter sp. DCM]|uniref:heavy metal translocating P-type ATPase n=1 Tax=Dehalobacter sp. DCM TaxID=2907827 RepID=UPI003081D95D|nr:cadmium-translocating P-type ATPase [Dehalobacter sp. DCM]